MSGYAVGQTVCVVTGYSHSAQIGEATIEKIGRRWITLSANAGRFDASDGRLDGAGYHSPGHVYPTREAYECVKALDDAWTTLKTRVDRIGYRRPAHMTADAIAQVSALLFPEARP